MLLKLHYGKVAANTAGMNLPAYNYYFSAKLKCTIK